MGVKQTKWPRLSPPRRRTQFTKRFYPSGGMNTSAPVDQLRSDEAATIDNFDLVDGGRALRRRNIYENFTSSHITSVVIGPQDPIGMHIIDYRIPGAPNDEDKDEATLVWSGKSVFMLTQRGSGWVAQALTAEQRAANSINSGNDATYFDTAEFMNSNLSKSVVYTNRVMLPGVVYITGTGSLSVANVLPSSDSYFEFCESVDERMVYFNSRSSTSIAHPTRVTWSSKGELDDATAAEFGPGFQDLANMQGDGTGIISWNNGAVLFSQRDVWFARPRNDAFAFDFFLLSDTEGCPFPRTIARTDAGVMWVGKDFQVRLLDRSNQINTVSQKIHPTLQAMEDDEGIRTRFATSDDINETYDLYFYLQNSAATGFTKRFRYYPKYNAWVNDRFGPTNFHPKLSFGSRIVASDELSAHSVRVCVPSATSGGTEFGTTITSAWRPAAVFDPRDPDAKQQISSVRVSILDTALDESAGNQHKIFILDEGQTAAGNFALNMSGIPSSNYSPVYVPVTTHARRYSTARFNAIGGKPKIRSMAVDFKTYTGRF